MAFHKEDCLHCCRYVACMNPTAGSFVVNPRLQRLFMTLAVEFPGQESLMKIYGTFITGHFKKFSADVQVPAQCLLCSSHGCIMQISTKLSDLTTVNALGFAATLLNLPCSYSFNLAQAVASLSTEYNQQHVLVTRSDCTCTSATNELVLMPFLLCRKWVPRSCRLPWHCMRRLQAPSGRQL